MTSSSEITGLKDFSTSAQSLSRTPLGIIALFIVLVYAFSALVLIFSHAAQLSIGERIPLICFMVLFPGIVIWVFTNLLINHTEKIYGPDNFKNEDNFMSMMAKASLMQAQKNYSGSRSINKDNISKLIDKAGEIVDYRNNTILWVDDNPQNNATARTSLESSGYKIQIATSTQQALELIENSIYLLIVSDMGRKEGSEEGLNLLKQLRIKNISTPFIIYTTAQNVEIYGKKVKDERGYGAVTSPVKLYEAILSLTAAQK